MGVCVCLCYAPLPRGAMGWSVIFDGHSHLFDGYGVLFTTWSYIRLLIQRQPYKLLSDACRWLGPLVYMSLFHRIELI